MSSFIRKMQRRNERAKDPKTARRLRGQKRGFNLGVRNAKAPKPNSLGARGSRRTLKNIWRSQVAA